MDDISLYTPRAKSIRDGGNRMVSNWTTRHESIVYDKLNGLTNVQLAEKYDLNQSYISQIWNSRQAVAIRNRVKESIFKENEGTFDERRKQACLKAFENMEKFLNNKELAVKAPFPFFDRSVKAYEVLSETQTPYIPSSSTTNITNNVQLNVLSDPEKRKHLGDGLTRALEVARLHENVTGESIDGSIRTGTDG